MCVCVCVCVCVLVVVLCRVCAAAKSCARLVGLFVFSDVVRLQYTLFVLLLLCGIMRVRIALSRAGSPKCSEMSEVSENANHYNIY
jgi:hypothetical protein